MIRSGFCSIRHYVQFCVKKCNNYAKNVQISAKKLSLQKFQQRSVHFNARINNGAKIAPCISVL